MSRVTTVGFALLTLLAGIVRAQAPETVTFAGYGGTYQRDIVKALIRPAAEREDARLTLASHNGLSAVRLQVKTGSPAWDIVQLGAEECAAGAHEGLFERLDYDVIDTRGMPPNAYDDYWIASNDYTVFMGWRRGKFGNDPPRDWADFWDVKRYPGARSLALHPSEMMEIALLADGVDPEQLYPLDVPRALESLARLAPHIDVWWSSGAQASHLLADGDVDLIAIWGSRLAPLLKEKGNAIRYTFNQALVNYSCLAILRGSQHKTLVERLINHVVSPELQANILRVLPYYGPANELALNEGVHLTDAFAAANALPENRAKRVRMNAKFWGPRLLKLGPQYLAVVIVQ